MSRMCFFLLLQVAVAASVQEVPPTAESCSAGSEECSGDSNVLIQKKVATSIGDGDDWSVTASDFSDSMTVTAMVFICDYTKPGSCDNPAPEGKGELAAFLKDDTRGTQDTPMTPPFGPFAGKPEFPVTIHGRGTDSGDMVFKFKDEDHCITELKPAHEVAWKVNGNEGSFTNPLKLTAGWSFNPKDYSDSMTLEVVVEIDGKEQDKGVLAAFIDGEIRGVATKPNPPPFGPNQGDPFYTFMVHADGTESKKKKVTYKYRACDGTVTELNADVATVFETDEHFGNVVNNKITFKGGSGGGGDTGEIGSDTGKPAAPACQDDEEGMKKAFHGWGCTALKDWCIGMAKFMKVYCKATCKKTFPNLGCV